MVVDKAGSWYSYNGDRLGQGKDNVRTYLKENPELALEIENKIRAAKGVSEAPAPDFELQDSEAPQE